MNFEIKIGELNLPFFLTDAKVVIYFGCARGKLPWRHGTRCQNQDGRTKTLPVDCEKMLTDERIERKKFPKSHSFYAEIRFTFKNLGFVLISPIVQQLFKNLGRKQITMGARAQ